MARSSRTPLAIPMDLNALYYRQMRKQLRKMGVAWRGWHGFRRGLASNLNRLGVDDTVIQSILRHSDVSLTQRCYIKTTSSDAVAAMGQLSVRILEVQRQSDDSFSCRPRTDSLPTIVQ